MWKGGGSKEDYLSTNCMGLQNEFNEGLGPTSHTKLRARDQVNFKHSHWWERRSRSKFASHYDGGTNEACKCKMDVKSIRILTWHWMDHVSWSLGYFQQPPLRGRPHTTLGDHGTPNAHNHGFIILLWVDIHRKSIWLRAWSQIITAHYTRTYVTMLHDFGDVLGWALDTSFGALTISWSQLLARVWNGL